MANTLNEVTPQLLAMGLRALREQSFMPLVVNREYDEMAGQRGSTIDVPIPSAIAAQDVSPAATPPSTADVSPTSVPIALDQWKEAPFYLTDKDQMEVQRGTLPMQASEAVKSLANAVNNYILGLYTAIYGYTGTAGTTPFASDTSDATDARKILNTQLAPMDPRRMVIDPDAEANALNLRAFQDASFSTSGSAILEGQINRKLGFDWLMHQLVPTHTAGTAVNKTVTLTSDSAADATSVTLDNDSGTSTLLEGDIISFAGHSQTYVVTADATLTTGGVSVSIDPPLQQAVDGSGTAVAVTVRDDHTVNLAFHRDAIAFATRPLAGSNHPNAVIEQRVDQASGLALRLEVSREHKRDRFSFDVLYGAAVIRPELAVRLAG